MSKLTVTTNSVVRSSSVIEEYRQLVAQRYTASSPEDLQRMISVAPYFVSRKIDGELWFVTVDGDGVQLSAANGRVADGDSEIHKLAKTLPSGTVIAGELHVPNPNGRERVGDVSSNLAQGGAGLAFAAFDIVQHPEFSWQDSQFAQRLEVLKALLPANVSALSVIEVSELQTLAEIQAMFTEVVEKQSGEGLVVKGHDGRILKVKPSISLDLAIIGFTTQPGAKGEEVRSLMTALVTEDGSFVPVGNTGNTEGVFDRADLLARLLPLAIQTEYRQASSTGQMYQAVKPEVIVECRMLDIQNFDSQGKPIRKPTLEFAGDNWRVTSIGPAISLINAVIVRLRDDKADVLSGARWSQLPEQFGLTAKTTFDKAESQVIRRQVWTKESKDKVDVRKLIVWKTNKDSDPLFPAYVVHWTDFSAGRKAPLAREVKVAANEKDAIQIADLMIEENIKKGWVENV